MRSFIFININLSYFQILSTILLILPRNVHVTHFDVDSVNAAKF